MAGDYPGQGYVASDNAHFNADYYKVKIEDVLEVARRSPISGPRTPSGRRRRYGKTDAGQGLSILIYEAPSGEKVVISFHPAGELEDILQPRTIDFGP